MVFRLAYLHLILANSKGQDQGDGHIDCEFLEILVKIVIK